MVVVAIGSLWFIGYQTKQKTEAKLQTALQEALTKQQNLEKIVQGEVKNQSESSILITPQTPKIKTGTSSDSTALHQYGLDLAKALTPLSTKRDNEIKAVLSAIDKNDPALLKNVTASRINHDLAIENLLNLTVPKILETKHQDLIIKLQIVSELLQNMEQALSVPKLALNSSNLLIDRYNDFLKELGAISNFLSVNKINFADNEKVKIFLSLN